MDWRVQRFLPAAAKPSEQEEVHEEDESDEESDSAPKEFFKDARDIIPSVSNREIMMVWDKSTGIGGKAEGGKKVYDIGSKRVQAAIGFLIDLNSSSSSSNSKISTTTMLNKNNNTVNSNLKSLLPSASSSSPLQVSEVKQRPLFRAPSPDTPPDEDEDEDSDIEIQDFSVELPARKNRIDVKGKGKAREIERKQEVVVLSDSDDEVQVFSRQPSKGNNNRGQAGSGSTSSSSHSRPQPQPHLKPRSQLRHQSSPSPPAARVQARVLNEQEAITMILTIIPDVLPSHIRDLLKREEYNNDPNSVVEALLLKGDYSKKELAKVVEEKQKMKKRAREAENEIDYLVVKGRPAGNAEF